jgi:uncharacterized membrane protein YtjA (UPF0391 family)
MAHQYRLVSAKRGSAKAACLAEAPKARRRLVSAKRGSAKAACLAEAPKARRRNRHAFRIAHDLEGMGMLHMALVFLVIGLIAALLGFTTIAGASIAIAKFLAGLFLLLFLVFLIIGLAAGRRILS